MRLIFKLILLILPSGSYAQQPKIAAGSIIRFENYLSKYVQTRTIDVWLPPGYVASKKYAVLYMQDGQMLFDSTITWNKQEWMVDEQMISLSESKLILDCIVVAIPNAGDNRLAEYIPYKPISKLPVKLRDSLITNELQGRSQSDNYLLFLVKELKPFIDGHFSTYKDQRHTFIAGSSLGALISLYAICEYPRIFYGAACISTHWPGSLQKYSDDIPFSILNYLENHLPDPDTHRIYFDYGSKGLDRYYKRYQRMADKLMKEVGYKKKNWLTREFEGEDHTENAWSNRLKVPLSFLLAIPDPEDD